jgi:GNAT superfamily N-acetyltransferase
MKIQDRIQIRELTFAEAREIYVNHLRKDFPRSERKPFSRIRSAMQKGEYSCYGAWTGDELAGYAFLAYYRLGESRIGLLDYFAVLSDRRGQGLGSEILRRLSPDRLSLSCILIETEKIMAGLDDEEREIRKRRVCFYERAGASRSGVSTSLFGVDFDILIMPESGKKINRETAWQLTDFVYRRMYRSLRYNGTAQVLRLQQS